MAATMQSPLRRSELRSEIIESEIKGIATRTQQREHSPFILWDISDRGVRLWMPERVKTGEILRLTIARPFVVMLTCEVRWCKSSAQEGGFQIGLRVLDNLQRLEALHRALVRGEAAREAAEGSSEPNVLDCR